MRQVSYIHSIGSEKLVFSFKNFNSKQCPLSEVELKILKELSQKFSNKANIVVTLSKGIL